MRIPFDFIDRDELISLFQNAGFNSVSVSVKKLPFKIPGGIDLDAKDDGAAGIRGAESGIYQLILSPVTNRVTVTPSNGVYTTPNTIQPGFPDGNSGPLNDSQTFDATCTSQGIAVIPATASDAAGNEVVRPLQIECYP